MGVGSNNFTATVLVPIASNPPDEARGWEANPTKDLTDTICAVAPGSSAS